MNKNINDRFNNLSNLGWDSYFDVQTEQLLEGAATPARVAGVRKNSFLVNDGENE